MGDHFNIMLIMVLYGGYWLIQLFEYLTLAQATMRPMNVKVIMVTVVIELIFILSSKLV